MTAPSQDDLDYASFAKLKLPDRSRVIVAQFDRSGSMDYDHIKVRQRPVKVGETQIGSLKIEQHEWFIGCSRFEEDGVEWVKLHPSMKRAIEGTFQYSDHDAHREGFIPRTRPMNTAASLLVFPFDGCLMGTGYLCTVGVPMSAFGSIGGIPVFETPLNDALNPGAGPGRIGYARVGTLKESAFFVTHVAGEWLKLCPTTLPYIVNSSVYKAYNPLTGGWIKKTPELRLFPLGPLDVPLIVAERLLCEKAAQEPTSPIKPAGGSSSSGFSTSMRGGGAAGGGASTPSPSPFIFSAGGSTPAEMPPYNGWTRNTIPVEVPPETESVRTLRERFIAENSSAGHLRQFPVWMGERERAREEAARDVAWAAFLANPSSLPPHPSVRARLPPATGTVVVEGMQTSVAAAVQAAESGASSSSGSRGGFLSAIRSMAQAVFPSAHPSIVAPSPAPAPAPTPAASSSAVLPSATLGGGAAGGAAASLSSASAEPTSTSTSSGPRAPSAGSTLARPLSGVHRSSSDSGSAPRLRTLVRAPSDTSLSSPTAGGAAASGFGGPSSAEPECTPVADFVEARGKVETALTNWSCTWTDSVASTYNVRRTQTTSSAIVAEVAPPSLPQFTVSRYEHPWIQVPATMHSRSILPFDARSEGWCATMDLQSTHRLAIKANPQYQAAQLAIVTSLRAAAEAQPSLPIVLHQWITRYSYIDVLQYGFEAAAVPVLTAAAAVGVQPFHLMRGPDGSMPRAATTCQCLNRRAKGVVCLTPHPTSVPIFVEPDQEALDALAAAGFGGASAASAWTTDGEGSAALPLHSSAGGASSDASSVRADSATSTGSLRTFSGAHGASVPEDHAEEALAALCRTVSAKSSGSTGSKASAATGESTVGASSEGGRALKATASTRDDSGEDAAVALAERHCANFAELRKAMRSPAVLSGLSRVLNVAEIQVRS